MAVGKRLIGRRAFRFAGIVALVLTMHALSLRWLAEMLHGPVPLKTMADPMFTRVLQPEAPPPVVAAAESPAPAPAPRTRTIQPARKASAPKRAASRPEPPASEAAADAEVLPMPMQEAAGPAEAPASAAASASPGESVAAESTAAPASATASAPEQAVASAAAPTASVPAVGNLDTWPVDTRVVYRLTGYYRGDLTGSGRVQWQRQDDRYQVRVDLDFGLFGYSFMSQGEVAATALLPRAYQEQSPNRTRVVRMDPDRIVLNDGRTIDKPGAVQDTASQFVEIAHRLATGQAKLEVGQSTHIYLARPGGVDEWVYDVVGREVIATPNLGNVEAFHLKPRPITKPRGPFTAEMWYAPTLQYLPARIRVNMGTEAHVDLVVDRIEQR